MNLFNNNYYKNYILLKSDKKKVIRYVIKIIDGETILINKPLNNGLKKIKFKNIKIHKKHIQDNKNIINALHDYIYNKKIILHYYEDEIINDKQIAYVYFDSINVGTELVNKRWAKHNS